ncbi:hybrid sensor histidine kinase/response regulator [uncultured Acetatifactor sp.]|uniref:hybrid sensor histidine kinase/response regulator n=1 Tax=uncultured Acetatifactor sp. TaxID=1671927 RepID=UPI00263875EF|nr:response regulator [uncultured Acetatifactor sp.]
MGKRTSRFLSISLALISLFCILIFVGQAAYINYLGENALRQLGVFYMSGISQQVASHFGTTMELRLSQVESIVNSVPPGRYSNETSMRIGLTYNARSIGFEYLAFYTDDGSFHMLYGSQVTADVPEALHSSVQGGKYNVSAGKDAKGTPVVLIGVPAHYAMSDGSASVALVAGLPVSYLGDILESNIQSDLIEYSIIRGDGSYVLRNGSIEEQNYFDLVERLYQPYNGKTPAQYASELRTALTNGENYTSEIMISDEHWNIYCTRLPNSEWNLLFKISHSTLDETVNLLRNKWTYISIGGCCLIICALLLAFFLIFWRYYHLTKKQMQALDEARRIAEEAMLSAERSNKAKNEFLSNMSHDIRTPMNGIMGMASVAMSNLDNPARLRSCLKKIHVSGRHLSGLINDMLDLSKIENKNLVLNRNPICLRDIMQNITTIIQPQIQEKKQHFYAYAHDICFENVYSDRVRLSQILLNTVGNAVKFTPEGGTIEVDLYEEPSPRGKLYVRSHLHVRDNGIGMAEEFQARIFDAFAREDNARVDKEAGAGMGLTITKHIIDAMGGTVTVKSRQGKGSHFHITLDMEKILPQKVLPDLPRRNLLVIDDDAIASSLAVTSLESIGLQAEAASEPEQAFRMIEEHRGREDRYHLILLDWDMEGQNGNAIAKELSGRFGQELPILLLTEGEWDESEKSEETAAVRGFISKPLFRSNLYEGLRPFLEAPALPQDREEEAAPDLTGKRILMAEDNELNWEIANAILSEFGLVMEWAENGQICVEKFEQSPPAGYDAILMDLRMPVMTGFEAASAIRRSKREDARTIPIIAVSADAFEDDIQKCLDHGMNAHTSKPIDAEKILSLLRQYLR